MAANEVHWGPHSTLVATVSQFPELEIDLEVLGSRRSVSLTEDEANTL
jgi:hypothetical protein